ncbi:TAXI family TRAP transporter solute-binding subunit [Pseudomonas sp.]|uniref:TAXI family TRAP transporter solute-binding subunit n=1 Tax=unclassified Pseudomonas TaxID=196821 RepID=UPI0031DB8EE0
MQRLVNMLKDLAILVRANLWLVPVLAALVAALFYFVAPPPPMSATLATGAPGGGYAIFGEHLKEELAKQGFELNLVKTAGSRQNLEKLLDEGSGVNIGLVQSGQEQQLEPAQRGGLQTLGAMFQEPLWLFQRRDLKIDRIADLLPLRLAIGTPGSGTEAVTEAILKANDIPSDPLPANWQARGGNTVASELLAGTLDAAFFVGPAENPLIQRLAASPELKLAGFRRAHAYEARIPFLKRVEVSEGLLNLAQNVPEQDMATLSPVATLVINDNFHPALTPLILEAARRVMSKGTLLDPAGAFPSAEPRTLALQSDAERYYKSGPPLLQRFLPFRIASLADRYIILLIPFIAILIPLMKSIGPLYRWRIRARIYRWYRYLREIDRRLDERAGSAELSTEIERLEQLEAELAKVEVPLSYYNELYELHLHLNYVIRRLRQLRRNRRERDAGTMPVAD